MKNKYKNYILAIFLIIIIVYLTYDNIEYFFVGVSRKSLRADKKRQKKRQKLEKELNNQNKEIRKLSNLDKKFSKLYNRRIVLNNREVKGSLKNNIRSKVEIQRNLNKIESNRINSFIKERKKIEKKRKRAENFITKLEKRYNKERSDDWRELTTLAARHTKEISDMNSQFDNKTIKEILDKEEAKAILYRNKPIFNKIKFKFDAKKKAFDDKKMVLFNPDRAKKRAKERAVNLRSDIDKLRLNNKKKQEEMGVGAFLAGLGLEENPMFEGNEEEENPMFEGTEEDAVNQLVVPWHLRKAMTRNTPNSESLEI